ncbi:hypothetical protein M3Y94_00291700 [Aphelenchoides besseyi]|nr:hypothetical protein M3Y94_00291700 [Aphelenchoides besseyi]
MITDYAGRSTASNTTGKYAVSVQKRQRIDQINLALSDSARTRNNASRPTTSSPTKVFNKQTTNKPVVNRRQANTKDPEERTIRTRSKNGDDEEAAIKSGSQQCCMICKRGVRNTRDLRHCSKCKNCAHASCNNGFVQLTANSYACPECLKSEKSVSTNHSIVVNNSAGTNVHTTHEEAEEYEEDALMSEGAQPSTSILSSDEEVEMSPAIAQRENAQNPTPIVPQQNDSIAASVQNNRRNRRTKNRDSPMQENSMKESNSSGSDGQTSPMQRTRISSSPACSSIGLLTTGDPSNDAPTSSENSMSPEFEVSRVQKNAHLEERQTKPTVVRSRPPGRPPRTPSLKKPEYSMRGSSTHRTRSGGKPASCLVQMSSLGKGERGRGRKNGKGAARVRRGKVVPSTSKARNRTVQPYAPQTSQAAEEPQDVCVKARSHDDNDYVRTAIVTSATDKFMDFVSLCLVCGSVGRDAEGTMLTCASCAQSYHTYCVNMHDKLNSTVIERGWRCLDCTVCEGCGTDKDESNLLLCDECDISYHIYCLDPPLAQIPNGSWRCKWCATCGRCNKQVQSGLDLAKLEGLCETCYSLRKCPKCTTLYDAGDLLVKCQHCIRWFHARCEDLTSEEQVENAAENSFRCTFCRPKINAAHDQNSSLIIDNVMISRTTFEHIGTLRRPNSGLSFSDIGYRSISIDNDEMEFDETDPPYSGRGSRGGRGGPGRRMMKLGIGGFNVRVPKQKLNNPGIDENNKEPMFGNGQADDDETGSSSQTTFGKRARRPRRPRRPKLEDAYPSAIQEAFFGTQAVDSKSLLDVVVEEPVIGEHFNITLEDKKNKINCVLNDQTADALRAEEERDMLGDIMVDEFLDIDSFDFTSFIEAEEEEFQANLNANANANTSSQLLDENGAMHTQLNTGAVGMTVASTDLMGDSQSDEKNDMKDEEDEDTTVSKDHFNAQMEQNHERQRQIQQQVRLQMGTTAPAGQNPTEVATKPSTNPTANEKTTERWEEDEPLGLKATKAAVLYANMVLTNLKEEHPLWNDRVKVINRQWRMLSSDEREKYVKLARANRADIPKRRTKRTASSNNSGRPVSVADDLNDNSRDGENSCPSRTTDSNFKFDDSESNSVRSNVSAIHSAEQTQSVPLHAQPPNTQIAFNPNVPNGAQPKVMTVVPESPYPVAAEPSTPSIGFPTTTNTVDARHPSIFPLAANEPTVVPEPSHQEWEQYYAIRHEHDELEKERKELDANLNEMRKTKKNLAARRRHQLKIRQSLMQSGNDINPPPGRETSEVEAHAIDEIKKQIDAKQRRLERVRQELKAPLLKMQEFETQFNITDRNSVPVPYPPVPVEASLNPSLHLGIQQLPQQIPPQIAQQHPTTLISDLPSPAYPFVDAYNESAAFVPFKPNGYYGLESPENSYSATNQFYSANGIRLSGFNGNHSPASPTGSAPQSPSSARPQSSASTEVPQKRGRKRKRPNQIARSAILGGVSYVNISDPVDKEIYDVLDTMVHWVSSFDMEALVKKLPTLRTATANEQSQSTADGPRAKKKRQQLKKPLSQEANEYDSFIDKLQNQLKMCPLPLLTYEQSSFIDTSIPNFPDMTQLPEEIGQEFIEGNDVDSYSLSFMPDYYSGVEKRTVFDQVSLYPEAMSSIYVDVNVSELDAEEPEVSDDENEESPLGIESAASSKKEPLPDFDHSMNSSVPGPIQSTGETSETKMHVDEVKLSANNQTNVQPTTNETNTILTEPRQTVEVKQEPKSIDETRIQLTNVDNYTLFWQDIDSDLLGARYSIPLLAKLSEDDDLPMPPHRSTFKSQKSRHIDHQFAVSLTIENMDLNESVLHEIRALINHPNDLEVVEEASPPLSPSMNRELRDEPMDETESLENQICRQCDCLVRHHRVIEFMVTLGIDVTDEEDLNTFCSMPCYLIFMSETRMPVRSEVYSHASRFVDDAVLQNLCAQDNEESREFTNTANELQLDLNLNTVVTSQQSITSLLSPTDTQQESQFYPFGYQQNTHQNEMILRITDLPAIGQRTENVVKGEYKWKGYGWLVYDLSLVQSFQKTQEEMRQRFATIQMECNERNKACRSEDTRSCGFCGGIGDGEQGLTGRLLNIDANEWVHVNCALWSPEVHETEAGALFNVNSALRRARTVPCKVCEKSGASLRCYILDCDNNKKGYHLTCAKQANGKFSKSKEFYCSNHDVRPEACVAHLDTLRRIYVQREENQLLSKIFNHTCTTDMMMRVGSMIFRSIGQLLPEQLKAFHTEEHIFPIGYRITRLFWSPTGVNDRSRYDCSIIDVENEPMFRVIIENQGREFIDRTMSGAWSRILQQVQQTREKNPAMLRFYPSLMNSASLFGLLEPSVTKMIESLPGMDQLFTYSFRHGGLPLMDVPLAINPAGCARCEPRFRTNIKQHRYRPLITQSPKKKNVNTGFNADIIPREARRTRSQRSLLSSAYDEETIRMMRASGITENMLTSAYVRYETNSIPNAHSQYRKMKQEWQTYVYLARSKIQGLGLYAKRDLDMNTIIIEYVGELIRSELGEIREKKYVDQNRGVYMFRIDEEYLIDATMCGGLARYVNHSCDPNCSTKILQYNDEKKIVIMANRPIKAGEELTYDYQFELEDDSEKIQCLCGAPNCNKWMN